MSRSKMADDDEWLYAGQQIAHNHYWILVLTLMLAMRGLSLANEIRDEGQQHEGAATSGVHRCAWSRATMRRWMSCA